MAAIMGTRRSLSLNFLDQTRGVWLLKKAEVPRQPKPEVFKGVLHLPHNGPSRSLPLGIRLFAPNVPHHDVFWIHRSPHAYYLTLPFTGVGQYGPAHRTPAYSMSHWGSRISSDTGDTGSVGWQQLQEIRTPHISSKSDCTGGRCLRQIYRQRYNHNERTAIYPSCFPSLVPPFLLFCFNPYCHAPYVLGSGGPIPCLFILCQYFRKMTWLQSPLAKSVIQPV
jgi:hypothetical protein